MENEMKNKKDGEINVNASVDLTYILNSIFDWIKGLFTKKPPQEKKQ
jgi:hypothetical protein